MNKILNWTFGACFRTLGRFLAIFLVGVLLIFIGSKIGIEFPGWLVLKVNAAQSTTWDENIENNLDYYLMYDLTETSYTNLTLNSSPFTKTDGTEFTSFVNASPITLATNGIMHTFGVNQRLKPGYLYSITYYQCGSKRLYYENTTADLFVGSNSGAVASRPSNTISWQQSNITELAATEVYCNMVTSLIVPAVNGSWIGLRLRASGSSISSFYLRSYGYNIKELGIYSSTIEDIIDNSGFATSESVEQVQDSVSQVQQEIQQTQDTITDSTSPDVSDMTNLAGYLPPGPLDSVLNLPLSILNSLNSKLSSSCTPLLLTLPFVNLPLNIPCLSTIFNQIAGLNVLWESIGVILGALIMYKYLTYLYNWVDDVTSLKHTRARLFGAKSDSDNWGGVE